MKDELIKHVRYLTEIIGERHIYNTNSLEHTKDYIVCQLNLFDYIIELQTFDVYGVKVHNIECTLNNCTSTDEVVLITAHYDSLIDTVGANDNASSVAGLLELSKIFNRFDITNKKIRFVFFVNEEPPFYQTEYMGSKKYYQLCKQRGDNIKGMINLDLIGCYNGKQMYPNDIEGQSQGDFVLFTGSDESKDFIHECYNLYKQKSYFPIQMFTDEGKIERQFCNYSDHQWFNEFGSMLVTDTAFYRYPWYHSSKDTWDKLNYDKMQSMLEGLYSMLRLLC